MNKKASLADSVLVPAYILAIAMTIFIAYFVWTSFITAFTPLATNVNLPDGRNLTSVMSEATVSIGYLDYMFPMIVAGLMLVSLIFAYKTGANVIYAYVSVILWVLALIMSAVYSNVFEMFAASFPTESSLFPTVSYIMLNIKWIVLAWAVLISVVMFTRNSNERATNQAFASTERSFM